MAAFLIKVRRSMAAADNHTQQNSVTRYHVETLSAYGGNA
jgi:hypothetical protein